MVDVHATDFSANTHYLHLYSEILVLPPELLCVYCTYSEQMYGPTVSAYGNMVPVYTYEPTHNSICLQYYEYVRKRSSPVHTDGEQATKDQGLSILPSMPKLTS